MGVKYLEIDRSEASKYRSTSGTNGNTVKAKITYNNDGSINKKETYSSQYLKKLEEEEDEPEEEERYEKKSSDSDGCLMKIIKAPFRLLFWLVKKILKVLLTVFTLGLFNKLINEDE